MKQDDFRKRQQHTHQRWRQLMLEGFLIGCALVGTGLGIAYLATGGV